MPGTWPEVDCGPCWAHYLGYPFPTNLPDSLSFIRLYSKVTFSVWSFFQSSHRSLQTPTSHLPSMLYIFLLVLTMIECFVFSRKLHRVKHISPYYSLLSPWQRAHHRDSINVCPVNECLFHVWNGAKSLTGLSHLLSLQSLEVGVTEVTWTDFCFISLTLGTDDKVVAVGMIQGKGAGGSGQGGCGRGGEHWSDLRKNS